MPAVAYRVRSSVLIAYAAFVLMGISASVGAVVLPAQIADYSVGRSTVGITFFTFSAGFFLAGATTGSLMARLGTRTTLVAGAVAFVVADLYIATRPSFAALVAVQLLAGYGTGLVESVLNVHLSELPSGTTRLNLLHAFFGVGALIGPVLATWLLDRAAWTVVPLVLALLGVPYGVAFRLTYPAHDGGAPRTGATEPVRTSRGGGLLAAALREPGVVLAAVFLTVYVGVEMSLGNWGRSYLVEAHHQNLVLAGYSVSGYWLGLTVGRFVISPAAARLRWSEARMTTGCLVGVTVCAVLVWLAPAALFATAALAALGFFLGPLFPTAIAVVPRLTSPRLVPAAVGLMNAVSVIGGSALPWLAGTLGDSAGIWTLLPFVTALALVQLAVWRAVVARMAS